MALVWTEGFEGFSNSNGGDITTGMGERWATTTGSMLQTTGRLSGWAFSNSISNNPTFTTPQWADADTVIVGFGFRRTSSASSQLFRLQDDGTNQVEFGWNSSGQWVVTRFGTTIATGSTQMNTGVWYFVEFKVVINSSTGSVVSQIDGVEDINATSLNTQHTGNATVNQMDFLSNFTAFALDDLYVCDTTGSDNNDFLGDIQVITLFPDGAGTHTDFTPSTGSNYQNVDDLALDGDSTYNEASGVGDTDTYTFQNLTGTAIVKAVVVNLTARKSKAGFRQYAPVVRTGGTDFTGADIAATAGYRTGVQIYEVNPDTAATWSQSEVNAAEFGITITN